METQAQARPIVRFASYELDLHGRVLRKQGMRIRLQDQPFQVLATLLDRPGELVSRDELRSRVWPRDTFVDFDHALNTAVKKIRAALNDDADVPRYIETVPRRGYRFIAPVTAQATPEAAPAVSQQAFRAEFFKQPRLSRTLAVAFTVCVIGIALVFYLSNRRATAINSNPAPRRVMVAVLPFQNLSNDPSQEYFSDGMTEETISQLGRVNPEHMAVIARTSSMQYKHAMKGIDQIAKELHVDYVVEGSIRREGSRVRIAAQLIRTSDQYPRWTKNFDRNLSDIISLETEVASDIAGEIQSALGSSAPLQPLSSSPMMPGAHDAYLRGISGSDFRSQEGFNQVVAAFRDSVEMDPKSPQAWTGLASTYDYAGNYGLLSPKSAFTQAKAAAQKAIELDPNSPEAYIYLADSLVTLDLDWKQAEYEIQRALALNPNDASAHDWHGLFLFLSGRADEGIVEMRHAWQLDPLSTERMLSLASSLCLTDKLDDAATIFQIAINIKPGDAQVHEYLGYLYERQGKFEPAIKEWATAYRLMGQKDTEPAMLQAYSTSGFTAAKELGLKSDIQYWTALRNKQYASTYQIARDYALLGDTEHSIMWLEKTFEERDAHLLCLRRDSKNWFAKVSGDPRFMAIIKKIGYPNEQHANSTTATR